MINLPLYICTYHTWMQICSWTIHSYTICLSDTQMTHGDLQIWPIWDWNNSPPPCPLVLTYQHKRLYQQQFLGYHRQDLQVIPKKIIQAHISYNTTRWMQCICGKRECVQIVVASPIRQSPVLICWRRVSLSSDNRAEHYILSLARQWNRHVFLSSAVSEARRCLRRA